MSWSQENNYSCLVFPLAFQNIDPEITKNPEFPNVISCFVMDIGTILAKYHSYFLIDIGLISKIFKISMDDSSSFPGARLFELG